LMADYDKKYGDDHFRNHCWPIIENYGAHRWFEQPKGIRDAKLMKILQNGDVKEKDAAGMDWAAFIA